MDGVPVLLTSRVWGGRPRLLFLFLCGQLGGLIRYDRLETCIGSMRLVEPRPAGSDTNAL